MIRFAKAGVDMQWENNGRRLSWSFANQYFCIDPDKIIEAARKNKRPLSGAQIVDVDIKPDEIITVHLRAVGNGAKGMVALTHAKIITMKGAQVIENGTVLINSGRIINVGESGVIKIPAEAKIYSLKGKTIIPGLIDMHYHDWESPVDVISKSLWKPHINLAYGITTSRNPGNSNLETFGWNELISTGEIVGPRLYPASNGIDEYFQVNSLDKARAIVNQRKQMGGIFIKQYSQPTRLQKQWLHMACREAGLNMTNEGEGQNVLLAIGFIKDGCAGSEHGNAWGDLYHDVLSLFKQSGLYLTPTTQTSGMQDRLEDNSKTYFRRNYLTHHTEKFKHFTPKGTLEKIVNEKVGDTLLFLRDVKNYAALRKNGALITMGGHGEDQGICAHFDIWAQQMGGITNHEALQSATILAAKGLGLQQDIGSIEPGKIADLLILDKDPLENIRNTAEIKYVMKGGILYDGNTLEMQWPQKQSLPEKESRVN